jgi:glycine dehydrogenase subunit 1
MGADIVVGEGQSIGNALNFGGPYVGLFTCKEKYIRQMPGRIVGETVDADGRRCFVNTLQAREQHIRREKAMSNICTNESLCALRATIYLALMGKQGFAEAARQCAVRAAYAYERLHNIPGVHPAFPGRYFFNEFALALPRDAAEVVSALIEQGIAAGFPVGRYYAGLSNVLLVACTEQRTKAEVDILAARLESVL